MTISEEDKQLVYNLAKPAEGVTDQVILEGHIRLVTYLEQVIPNTSTVPWGEEVIPNIFRWSR
jgi:hypothetical protein